MGFADRIYSHFKHEWSTYAVGAACAGIIYFCGYMASRGSEKTINRPIIGDTDNNRNRLEQKVNKQRELGIQGEPAFFVNGSMISAACPESTFMEAIDAEMNRDLNTQTAGEAIEVELKELRDKK